MTSIASGTDGLLGSANDAAPPAPAEYFQAAAPGRGAWVRINLGVVERLAREVRHATRDEGEQLGGILLGTPIASSRCAVIEDYQTVTMKLDPERPYGADAARASLERALTIWRSDPEGSIRAIGLFRTDSRMTPAPGDADVALMGSCLLEPCGVLLVLGSERDGTAQAAVWLAETERAPRRWTCVRFPWNRAELAGWSGAYKSTGARAGRRWLAAAAGVAGVALLGAGLAGDLTLRLPGVENPPRVAAIPAPAPDQRGAKLDLQPILSAGAPAPAAELHRRPEPAPFPGYAPALKPSAFPPKVAVAAPRIGEPPAGSTAVPPAAPAPPPFEASSISLPPAPAEPSRAPGPAGRFQEPVLIYRPQASYPVMASRERISGTVQVAAIVQLDGRLRNVHALGGPPLLLEPAVEAVKEWRYKPAFRDGKPVEAEVVVELAYRLDQ